jgi:glycosyltransferase involved in cell wall biosynthesis
MISVCIPVYNFDVGDLTRELERQLSTGREPYEILLMDDASDKIYRETNSVLASKHIRYIQLTENIGRSKIRNKLVANARYPYLIFMDCDSKIPSDHYIKNYKACCRPYTICYGGRIYETKRPEKQFLLRWKYGVRRESLPADVRRKEANYGFCTNNFLIYKPVFSRVHFNEDLKGYGHEDTLFGLELMVQGMQIEHIDNPLVHIGLERAEDFLLKTENSVLNLFRIDRILKEKCPAYVNHSALMRTYHKIERSGAIKMTAILFACFRPLIRRNLLGGMPFLRLFDLYKLGILCGLRFAGRIPPDPDPDGG